MSGDERELIRVQGMIAAQPILAALRANDIPARTRAEAVATVYALTLDGLGEVAILVPADRLDDARALLEAGEHGQLAPGDDEACAGRSDND
jgi:hypothetical protein